MTKLYPRMMVRKHSGSWQVLFMQAAERALVYGAYPDSSEAQQAAVSVVETNSGLQVTGV